MNALYFYRIFGQDVQFNCQYIHQAAKNLPSKNGIVYLFKRVDCFMSIVL